MGFYRLTTQVGKLRSKIFNDLAPLITEGSLQEAFAGFTIRNRTYHIWPVFQIFLHQVATNGSCSDDGEEKDAVIFTTLLNRKLYPKRELAEFYRRRWDMELAFRHIKTSMNLEMLKCKTPKRCRCELWMGLLAYNIIRGVMLDAARKAKASPTNISFTGTMHHLRNFGFAVIFNDDPRSAYTILLNHILVVQVRKRPGRMEPRKLKRRNKQYSWLTEPRKTATRAVLRA